MTPKNQKETDQEIIEVTWDKVYYCCKSIANWIIENMGDNTVVYGVPRGGLAPAVNVVHHIEATGNNARFVASLDHLLPGEWHKLVIIDEICDGGDTLTSISERFPEARTAVLFCRGTSKFEPNYSTSIIWDERWLRFPWEAI